MSPRLNHSHTFLALFLLKYTQFLRIRDARGETANKFIYYDLSLQ